MEIEFIRKYASRMSVVFASRAFNAKNRGEKGDYIKDLEARRNLWEKVARLPANSDKWETVKEYISLMSTPKTSQMELRRQYKFLQETISNTDLNNSQNIPIKTQLESNQQGWWQSRRFSKNKSEMSDHYQQM